MKKSKQTTPLNKKNWLLILLGIMLSLSLLLNIILGKGIVKVLRTQFYTARYADVTIEKLARFGETTWIWRRMGQEKIDGQSLTNYVLIHKDASGKETVLYQAKQNNVFGRFYWNFNEGGDSVVITDIEGMVEGSLMSSVAFKNNQEIFRSWYDSYGPYIQNFTFKTPHSSEYEITLKTTETCRLTKENIENKEYVVGGANTELLGLTITAADDNQTFLLDKPQTVPCAVIDGVTNDPTILDIRVNTSGIMVMLPGGTRAFISEDNEVFHVQFSPY